MLSDDVLDLIVADGNGTAATDLFRGMLPEKPDVAVAIYESLGLYDLESFDGDSLERPRFQVRARGAAHDYDGPRLRLEQVAQDLSRRGAFTVNNTRYAALLQLGTVFQLRRDLNNRWHFAVNFEAWKAVSST